MKKANRIGHGRKCIVNLDAVTFIDRSGERVLQGACLGASDVYVKHTLDRLRGKSNSPRSSDS